MDSEEIVKLGWFSIVEAVHLKPSLQPRLSIIVKRDCRRQFTPITIVGSAESIFSCPRHRRLVSLARALPYQTQPRLEKRDARTPVASLVAPRSLSAVYTLIGVVSSVGMLIAGPLLAGMFHLGMVPGDLCVSLPFLVAAGFNALALAVISAVGVGVVERG
ncbi:uncharacterized protein BO66DRAFT_400709 [Aspergillus aculeatinus CBS 121060]|uniref:Uncharacterized protein n=1 Tax=Aspergillus aculeatinus CBS 121060 TaxID=1448322 RepID=A0ACD1HCI5_9EURO|nr:hypothetical protein BO66DRAFT_400709 [Aspergillus aculeatinus CBS 121060]RAH71175.1 hypothetical protein BO66DRAFT_400709 [Aspergillus aculeatinus CBS 121060]